MGRDQPGVVLQAHTDHPNSQRGDHDFTHTTHADHPYDAEWGNQSSAISQIPIEHPYAQPKQIQFEDPHAQHNTSAEYPQSSPNDQLVNPHLQLSEQQGGLASEVNAEQAFLQRKGFLYSDF